MNSVYSKTGKKFIPWVILLVVVFIFDLVKVLPETKDWLDIKKEIHSLDQTINTKEKTQEQENTKLNSLKIQFENKAKDFVLEESQVFPTHFNPYEVSKILELFSIQHSLLSVDSLLRLERISFSGGGQPKPGDKFLQSKVSLEFLCSEETLKRVIKYLQTGDLPSNYLNNSFLDARDIEYLQKHKLPLAHIDSIRINQSSSDTPLKKITLDVSFFSQK